MMNIQFQIIFLVHACLTSSIINIYHDIHLVVIVFVEYVFRIQMYHQPILIEPRLLYFGESVNYKVCLVWLLCDVEN